jgi:hypothetical protein
MLVWSCSVEVDLFVYMGLEMAVKPIGKREVVGHKKIGVYRFYSCFFLHQVGEYLHHNR